MEDDTDNENVNPWGLRMFLTLQESDPQTPTEEAAFSKWMDQSSERQIARIDRIQGAEGILPVAPLGRVVLHGRRHLFVHALLRR